jgi:hypothetical protein
MSEDAPLSRTKENHMRNLLALFGLLVIGFAGAGWYMGWYKLSFSRSTDGNLEIKTNVDTKKVGSDINNAASAVGNQAEKAAQDANTNPPVGAPGSTPGPVTPPQNSPFNPLAPTPPNTPTAPVAPQGPFAPHQGPIQLLPPK